MSQKSSYQLKISSNALALEQLTRPLLRLLSQVTGMESAYLTIIDSDRGRQYVQYALNEDSMIIPDGAERALGRYIVQTGYRRKPFLLRQRL